MTVIHKKSFCRHCGSADLCASPVFPCPMVAGSQRDMVVWLQSTAGIQGRRRMAYVRQRARQRRGMRRGSQL